LSGCSAVVDARGGGDGPKKKKMSGLLMKAHQTADLDKKVSAIKADAALAAAAPSPAPLAVATIAESSAVAPAEQAAAAAEQAAAAFARINDGTAAARKLAADTIDAAGESSSAGGRSCSSVEGLARTRLLKWGARAKQSLVDQRIATFEVAISRDDVAFQDHIP